MTRDARAGMVGAVFGLVFVVVNAGDLSSPADTVIRVLGVIAFVAVLVALVRRGGARELPEVDPAGWRLYLIAVAFEVVALVVGLVVLNHTGHEDLVVPWIALVVGVHFLPLARAFRAPFYTTLAAALAVLGVAGGILALAGADRAVVSLVSGVLSGVVLLVTALRPTIPDRREGQPR